MKKHVHKFVHIGGGIIMWSKYKKDYKLPADDQYECSCKKGFVIRTTVDRHITMPDVYKQIPRSTKKFKVEKYNWLDPIFKL